NVIRSEYEHMARISRPKDFEDQDRENTDDPWDEDRHPIHPVWVLEEAGQTDAADTLMVPLALSPDLVIHFGDQNQLSPVVKEQELIRKVQTEIDESRQRWLPSVGSIAKVFTRKVFKALRTSFLEVSHAYSKTWETIKAGVSLGGGVGDYF